MHNTLCIHRWYLTLPLRQFAHDGQARPNGHNIGDRAHVRPIRVPERRGECLSMGVFFWNSTASYCSCFRFTLILYFYCQVGHRVFLIDWRWCYKSRFINPHTLSPIYLVATSDHSDRGSSRAHISALSAGALRDWW